jgi:hypothetical protein
MTHSYPEISGDSYYNKPALFFWRKAIPASVDGTVEEYAGDGKRWVGTVLCFDNRVRKS